MFIVPINANINVKDVAWSDELTKAQSQTQEIPGDSGFKQIFQGIVDNVETTQAQKREDAYNLSIGNMDEMHNMMINAAKADMALTTMVELRNKMLEAYSEVMRTTL